MFARVSPGYAAVMSDGLDSSETTPPGGPQRQDAPGDGLDHHDTGLISIEPRYLRIAHCSVDAAALPELVRRLEKGIAELVGTAG